MVLAVVLSGITVLLVYVSVTRPMARIAEWTKHLKTGQPLAPPPGAPTRASSAPLATEVTGLARTLARARHGRRARRPRLRLSGESLWTEERLKQFVEIRFGERPIFVVSNREPVSHVRQGRRDRRAAAGQRSGDRAGADHAGVRRRVGGPRQRQRRPRGGRAHRAADPTIRVYTLRRVWLTEEEEAGYYYGFANEGLWPLCHIVHERPQFRADDWEQYRAVNAHFAAALVEEMEKAERPIVLVQDYHFALLPQLIKQARPDARVALFWHIPWPNFEAFGICPWQEEILLGMLGADLVGFHTQFHCNNFLETVERTIEGRIEWDDFTAVRGQHTTCVRPFPISVAAGPMETLHDRPRRALRAELGVSAEWLGIGVERVDYTKGLPERFRAIRRFFERWPEYRRRMVVRADRLAQPQPDPALPGAAAGGPGDRARPSTRSWASGAGSRSSIASATTTTARSGATTGRADFCMVTSLHDGMNLVAKEYVAARDDEEGALILSRFTGASRELRDACLVNPYDVEDIAERDPHQVLTADASERRSRMARMRHARARAQHLSAGRACSWASWRAFPRKPWASRRKQFLKSL